MLAGHFKSYQPFYYTLLGGVLSRLYTRGLFQYFDLHLGQTLGGCGWR